VNWAPGLQYKPTHYISHVSNLLEVLFCDFWCTEETQPNTVKASNIGIKWSKLAQKNTQNAKPKQTHKNLKYKCNVTVKEFNIDVNISKL